MPMASLGQVGYMADHPRQLSCSESPPCSRVAAEEPRERLPGDLCLAGCSVDSFGALWDVQAVRVWVADIHCSASMLPRKLLPDQTL